MKIKKFKFILTTFMLLTILATSVFMFSGCGNNIEIDTSGMYLVIYDGNGGYLGNKTAHVRKMYCSPDSKIPDYPVAYTENQYTVPSLGLAMRDGYQLLGWYANADYRELEGAEYVYLDVNDGNGVYEDDAGGKYVRSYIESENGKYVFVSVEEYTAESEDDTTVPSYIYISGKLSDVDADGNETVIDLSAQPGFYVCMDETAIGEIDDDNLREAYTRAFAEKTYTGTQLAEISGWQLISELPEEFAELYADSVKYSYAFVDATEADASLDHYSIVSDYASLNSIFVDDPDGDYVFEAPYYVKYDAENPEHAGADRFSVNEKYVFTETDVVSNPSYLKRYDASMQYWNFAEDKVTQDVCTYDGEKYVLTLYAHWVRKNTVYYHYENGTDQVDSATSKLLADNITYEPISAGETIGKKEIIPLRSGYTFVGWSKTQGEYDPWDFENDVFPDDANELHLYAYYCEGTYTRIVSAQGLSQVGNDPAGKYFLVSDIDFGGKELTSSPLGLDKKVFTGEFISYGKTISGFTYKINANKQQAMDTSSEVGTALFPSVDGAVIKGLNIKGSAIFGGLGGKSVGGKKSTLKFYCGAIIGTASGNTAISDCSVEFTFAPKTPGKLAGEAYDYVIHLGDIAAYSNGYSTENCTVNVIVDDFGEGTDVIYNSYSK